MLLSQLEYFVAVAREQHFGRAAAACFISPSALSEAIRKLEVELGVPLVRRGRSFEGLTPEGELALVWAQRAVADDRALRAGLAIARDRLATEVRFGVIPSALPRAAALLAAFAERHPLTRIRMLAGLTTEEIVRRLRHYELDAGLIHPAVGDAEDIAITPLYEEAMVVAAGPAFGLSTTEPITGEQAALLPLGLLEPHMRARQLVDAAFARHDIVLEPRIESDSVEGLLDLARTGRLAVIVPRSALRAPGPELRVLELVAPEVRITIALAGLAEEPRSPIAAALHDAVLRSGTPLIDASPRSPSRREE